MAFANLRNGFRRMTKPAKKIRTSSAAAVGYVALLDGVSELLETARRASARTVNAFMTATYWEVGRRIVEFDQGGEKRAGYGEELLKRLAQDLSARVGRGFSRQNLQNMRQFYLAAPADRICQTLSGKLDVSEKGASLPLESGGAPIPQTLSAKSDAAEIRQTPSGKSTDAIRPKSSRISQTSSGIFQSPSEKSPQLSLALVDLARAFPLPWS